MLSRTRVEFGLHGPGYGFQAAKGRVLDPETYELAPGITLASRVPAEFFEPIESSAPTAPAETAKAVAEPAVAAPPHDDAPAAAEPPTPSPEPESAESPKGRRRSARSGEESQ